MNTQVNGKTEFQLRWLNYRQEREIITQLRNRVFNEVQQLGDFLVACREDEQGLHLGLFMDDQLVSLLTLYIVEPGSDLIEKFGLPEPKHRHIQFGRRAELPGLRNKRFASLLVAAAYKSVFELIEFDSIFFVMYGLHRQLSPMYKKQYLIDEIKTVATEHGEATVMIQQTPDNLARAYIMQRYIVEKFSSLYGIDIPDLQLHMDTRTDHVGLLDKGEPTRNVYLDAMSMADEMPRLSAQARLLFMSKKKLYSSLREPEEGYDILDAGCGPGVFLSSVSQLPNLTRSRFTGLDLSTLMITYARSTNPKLQWVTGNVYELPFESDSFDIINASFIMIHLVNPALALSEFYRVLRPGGKLIVTDVNDDSFEGPAILKRMVTKHAQVYEGNRKILNTLASIAQPVGFRFVQEDVLTVLNDGSEKQVALDEKEMHIDKYMMWGMFSFIEHNPHLTDLYGAASEYYFKYFPKASIGIYTHIYEKPEREY